MNDDEFRALAAKVLKNEANAFESALFKAELANHSTRQEQFDRMHGVPTKAKTSDQTSHANSSVEPGPQRFFSIKNLLMLFVGGMVLSVILTAVHITLTFAKNIEVGLRSSPGDQQVQSLALLQVAHVKTFSFEKEEDYQRWLTQDLAPEQKAKIWIDEAQGVIHIRQRTSFRKITERTESLRSDPQERQRQILEMVRSLQ